MTNKIITISREYGSGGRTVGELVAKELGVPFYDKEMVNAMAEACGFSHDFIEEIGEYASVTNSFLFSIAISSRMEGTVNMMSAADQLYACQANYIRELAEKGPCVIVGRCADYILREREDTFHAFIYADMDFRAKHMAEHYGKQVNAVPKWLKEKDNRRKVYYKHYTGRNWGDPHNYDVCLNTAATGIEAAADIIVKLSQG
jgi:cytidylate kinase